MTYDFRPRAYCAALMLALAVGSGAGAAAGPGDPLGFRVAFIADQGLGDDARAVLALIRDEGAHAVVHAGDFDYEDDPQAWDAMINDELGADFPYFAAPGNHDEDHYYGPGGYQEVIAARMARLGLPWEGDLGVRSSHTYRGVFFVMTAPKLFGDGDAVYAPYIEEQLAGTNAIWRVSAWHVLMRKMQVGEKNDESGWGVYEASRRGGAIVATGHEHSYARTHSLGSCVLQSVASNRDVFAIRRDDPVTTSDEGSTFVFHNGLGGRSIRSQERCLPVDPPHGCNGEWASVYTADQGADYGALFGIFGVDGDPCLARFRFKDVQGRVVDQFMVRSTLGACGCPDLDGSGAVDKPDLLMLLADWGTCAIPCPTACPADLTGDCRVDTSDLLALIRAWGPCPSE